MSCLTTKLREVHYNPCFEERAGHVFILPTGLDILSHSVAVQPGFCQILSETSKTGFVATQFICELLHEINCPQGF